MYRFHLDSALVPVSATDADIDNGQQEIDYERLYDLRTGRRDESCHSTLTLITPLREVAALTRDLRSLRAVNLESRAEGDRTGLWDCHVTLRGRKCDGSRRSVVPIHLPWKRDESTLCLVNLTAAKLDNLRGADTSSLDDMFKFTRKLGFNFAPREYTGIDWKVTGNHHTGDRKLLGFLERFDRLFSIDLVSECLMNEADLRGIDNRWRKVFHLGSWDDWVGRVDEEVYERRCSMIPDRRASHFEGRYHSHCGLCNPHFQLRRLNRFSRDLWQDQLNSSSFLPRAGPVQNQIARIGMRFRTSGHEDLRILFMDDEARSKNIEHTKADMDICADELDSNSFGD